MDAAACRILFVGLDLGLAQRQSAVLREAGYDATALGPAEAELLLNIRHLELFSVCEGFDLVILCSTLSEGHKMRIVEAADPIPILNLTPLTYAPDLMRMVRKLCEQDFHRTA